MTDTDERPTTQERYQRATQSSNLRPTRVGTTGDVDVIGAAAFVPDSLGVLLYRLVCKYDACRGEKARYEAEAFRLYQRQNQLRRQLDSMRKAPKPNHKAIAKIADEVDRVGAEARRETVTGRAMVLMELKGLHEAKEAK